MTRADPISATDLLEPPLVDPDPAAEDAYEFRVAQRMLDLEVDAAARERRAAARAGDQPLPTPIPLSRFLAVVDDDPDWAVDELMPARGNVLLVAPYKVGKSTLVANFLRSCADGELFLAAFSAVPARVTLIDDELDPRTLRRWLRDAHLTNEHLVEVVPLRGQVATFNILDPGTRTRWALALRGTQRLVVDCLRPILDALGLSEDKDGGRFLTALDALKREAGIEEVLLVHHTGHGGERARGDSRILDWPDAIWSLSREDPKDARSRRYFSAFGRDVDLAQHTLDYEPSSRLLTLTGRTRAEDRAADATPLVLAVLSTTEGRSQNQIEHDLRGSGIGTSTIRAALIELHRQGLTVKVNGPRGAILHSLQPTSPDLASTSPDEVPLTSPTSPYRGEARSKTRTESLPSARRGEVA